MSSIITRPQGHVEYTEGPEAPADSQATYSYTATDQPGRATLTFYVPYRTWQPEDGNDYLASQKQVTSKTYGRL